MIRPIQHILNKRFINKIARAAALNFDVTLHMTNMMHAGFTHEQTVQIMNLVSAMQDYKQAKRRG